jgi:osmotically-inducible protein OsmY
VAVRIRTDEAIQADVLEELKWDSRVRPNEIGVAVKDGIVTLTGWIDSYLKKMSAQEAAHRVFGVKAVANDIEVRVPLSAERTDTDLARVALNALNWDDAFAEKKAAEETACSASGITEVDNVFSSCSPCNADEMVP